MLTSLFSGGKKFVLLTAFAFIAAVALIDWHSIDELPLGFLYLLPMLMLGRVLTPPQIVLSAAVCTFLTEIFDEFVWNLRTGVPRDVLYFSAFLCTGLFVCEINRSRRIILAHLEEIERQRDARRSAEEQLNILVETSPAAIVITDSAGAILMANETAHRMLSVSSGELAGKSIHHFFPSLLNISQPETSQRFFRTVMQSRGQREDGEAFLAEICFSTYRTDNGMRLAAMILDASEELRTREEASLHQLLAGSRIAAAAVSHEVRNVSGAIAVVHQNLTRSGLLRQNKDFEALGSLIQTLERIASVDLRQQTNQLAEIDLRSVFDDLQIVIVPALREEDIADLWTIPDELPLVWADRQNLMQVFLNLISNSTRALAARESRQIHIAAKVEASRVLVEVIDNGGGVQEPDRLFRPFQQRAEVTGLGLFLSRAFMRASRGDLRYRDEPGGACFIVEMQIAGRASA